jgi:hypothetical protein
MCPTSLTAALLLSFTQCCSRMPVREVPATHQDATMLRLWRQLTAAVSQLLLQHRLHDAAHTPAIPAQAACSPPTCSAALPRRSTQHPHPHPFPLDSTPGPPRYIFTPATRIILLPHLLDCCLAAACLQACLTVPWLCCCGSTLQNAPPPTHTTCSTAPSHPSLLPCLLHPTQHTPTPTLQNSNPPTHPFNTHTNHTHYWTPASPA